MKFFLFILGKICSVKVCLWIWRCEIYFHSSREIFRACDTLFLEKKKQRKRTRQRDPQFYRALRFSRTSRVLRSFLLLLAPFPVSFLRFVFQLWFTFCSGEIIENLNKSLHGSVPFFRNGRPENWSIDISGRSLRNWRSSFTFLIRG